MKRKKNTKRGSVLVEAAIVLPLFILSVIMLSSLIPVTGTFENAVFSSCDEIRQESIKAVFRKNPAALSEEAEKRIKKENPQVTECRLTSLPYLYHKNGISSLITLKGTVRVEKNSIMGLSGKAEYELHITGRAFTGKKNRPHPMSRSEFEKKNGAEPVCVFPDYGEKYHRKDCTYVKASCERAFLNDEIRRKYKPCKLCHSEEAPDGTPVYIFTGEGEHYHLGDCKQVDRSYIEMEREEAEKKGYTACYKCGG